MMNMNEWENPATWGGWGAEVNRGVNAFKKTSENRESVKNRRVRMARHLDPSGSQQHPPAIFTRAPSLAVHMGLYPFAACG
jgi:hypothetical protein